MAANCELAGDSAACALASVYLLFLGGVFLAEGDVGGGTWVELPVTHGPGMWKLPLFCSCPSPHPRSAKARQRIGLAGDHSPHQRQAHGLWNGTRGTPGGPQQ